MKEIELQEFKIKTEATKVSNKRIPKFLANPGVSAQFFRWRLCVNDCINSKWNCSLENTDSFGLICKQSRRLTWEIP